MLAFLSVRLGQSLLVMLAVAFISFAMFEFVGDPVAGMVGQDTSLQDRDALRASLGLNDPIPLRFARFVGNSLQGNFGLSYRTAEPVGRMIAERLPATLELSLFAAGFALGVGLAVGVLTALYPRSGLSRLLLTVTLIGISLPTFLIGILLILVFAVILGWLPSFGRGQVVDLGLWSTGLLTISGWKALILPAITLGLYQMTLIARLVRSEMLEVLRADYIKFARARGLSDRSIHFGHALRNTLVPVVTVTGLQLGGIIAFSIVTETVFSWPGIGQLFIQSVQSADIPVMSTYLVMIGLMFVTINLCVDMLYFLVDPRIRIAGRNQ
jgi:peptide/nickel transport system permease protein